MSNQYVLGVDSSTSATKVIAFDASGKTVAEGANSYPLYTGLSRLGRTRCGGLVGSLQKWMSTSDVTP